MTRLLVYIRRYRWWYAFGICCTLAFGILQSLLPILSGYATQAVLADQPGRLVRDATLMIVLACLMGVARALSRAVVFNTGRELEYDLRNDLFAHMVTLSPSFYERLKTGDLMSRMINDLNAVRMMVG